MTESHPLKLSQLADEVKQVLNRAFDNLQFWVIADVTNHTQNAGTSYHYFELVEKAEGSNQLLAKFSVKAWGDGAREISLFETRTGQKFTNNIQVLVKVKVQYHPTFGLQLDLTGVDTNFTLGVLEQQRLATLERLCLDNPQFIRKHGEEYWTQNKSLKLPMVIQKVAVVCAEGSAGLQDFQHTMETNPFNYRFELVPYFTNVQGDANAAAMQTKMIDIFRSTLKFDLVVILRGGGAQTDFLIFDHYLIGRAIARFPVPVMTGIGHQKNTTIADLMAHTSVKTPTKAAEVIIEHNRIFEDNLLNIRKNIVIKVQQGLFSRRNKLTDTKSRITNAGFQMLSTQKTNIGDSLQVIAGIGRRIPYQHRIILANLSATLLSHPKIVIAAKKSDLNNIKVNINYYQKAFFNNTRGYLNHSISIFRAISPENTLKRGFAIIRYNGKIISDPAVLKKGDNFDVQIKNTDLNVVLQNKTTHNGK